MQNFYFTAKGLEYLAKTADGSKLVFTKGKFGDGIASGSVQSLTDLANPLGELALYKITTGSGTANVQVQFSNEVNGKILDQFYLRELGLFAKVQDSTGTDDTTRPETLVAYAYEPDPTVADVIPAVLTEYIIAFPFTIANSDNVSIEVSSLAYAKQADLQELLELPKITRVTTTKQYIDGSKNNLFYVELSAAANMPNPIHAFLVSAADRTDTESGSDSGWRLSAVDLANGHTYVGTTGDEGNSPFAITTYKWTDMTEYVADGSITEAKLDDGLTDKITVLEKVQKYSTTPVQVGTWIDGTPVWRWVFMYTFTDEDKETIQSNLDYMVTLPITDENAAFVVNAWGQLCVLDSETGEFLPCFIDDEWLPYEGNGHFAISESRATSISNGRYGGIYGWFEFVTAASNIKSS